MIAELEYDEREKIIKSVERELKKDYPKIHVVSLDVDFDGTTIFARCDYEEHRGKLDGDRIEFEIDINDTPCTNDPLFDIPDYIIDEFVTAIADNIVEMNEEEEED